MRERSNSWKAVANLSAIAIDNARMHQNLQKNCDLWSAHKCRMTTTRRDDMIRLGINGFGRMAGRP